MSDTHPVHAGGVDFIVTGPAEKAAVPPDPIADFLVGWCGKPWQATKFFAHCWQCADCDESQTLHNVGTALATERQHHAEQLSGVIAKWTATVADIKDAHAAQLAEKGAELLALRAALKQKDDELETERLRLAACTTAALGNTPESVAQRLAREHPYWSASYRDVCDTVDREIALRAAHAQLREQICQQIEERAKATWLQYKADDYMTLGDAVVKFASDTLRALAASPPHPETQE